MALGIKRDKLDILVSEYIRKKSGGYCERCGKYYGWKRLHTCHFHGRSRRSVRYDEDNLVALDFGCHQFLDSQPLEKVEFFKVRLGEDRFDMLNSRMRQTHPKPDKELLTLYYQQRLAGIGM